MRVSDSCDMVCPPVCHQFVFVCIFLCIAIYAASPLRTDPPWPALILCVCQQFGNMYTGMTNTNSVLLSPFLISGRFLF